MKEWVDGEPCVTTLLDNVVLRSLLDCDLPVIFKYPRLIDVPKNWYVATFLEATIGAIGYSVLGRNCCVNYIYVDPAYRMSGVGRSLVYRVSKDLANVVRSMTIHVPLKQGYADLFGFAQRVFKPIVTGDNVIFIRR